MSFPKSHTLSSNLTLALASHSIYINVFICVHTNVHIYEKVVNIFHVYCVNGYTYIIELIPNE